MTLPPPVLTWLLDPAEPSVRYRTLTCLLGRERDDHEVVAARRALTDDRRVARLLAAMHPDAYWLHCGRGADRRYAMCGSTHFVLSYLGELGLDRSHPDVARAAERYLGLDWPDDWYQSCLDFQNVRTFVMLGYRDHPQVERWVQVMERTVRHDGGYLCTRPAFGPRTKGCIRGTLKALTAYAVLPELWRSPRCLAVVDYFLSRRLLFRKDRPAELVRAELGMVRFPFVIAGSLLEPLSALSRMGYGAHPALADAWDLLAARRTPDGRYLLDRAATGPFKPGPAGAPNKWATVYAYLALRGRDRAEAGVPEA